jgi:hypothetical protein
MTLIFDLNQLCVGIVALPITCESRGPGYAGLGLTNTLSNCKNYTLIADTTGDTSLNSTGGTGIHFRNNNNGGNSYGDLATIDNSGNMTVAGTVHSGNAMASVSASNTTVASTGDCTNPLSEPNSNCLTPNMSVTVTTSGGPVLVLAHVGGIEIYNGCVSPNFYLTMDNQFISTDVLAPPLGYTVIDSLEIQSLQVPAAGTHTFQVQESDNTAVCSAEGYDYDATSVSDSCDGPGWPAVTRSLIVREF